MSGWMKKPKKNGYHWVKGHLDPQYVTLLYTDYPDKTHSMWCIRGISVIDPVKEIQQPHDLFTGVDKIISGSGVMAKSVLRVVK